MTQQGIPGLGYKQGRVGGDLDHERNLSQAGKYFTLGGIKGPYVSMVWAPRKEMT